MKRNGIKTMIAVILTLALAAATAVPSLAKNGRENATITYRDVKVYANDELLVPLDPAGKPAEPFIMNGTTYLPLRAVGEAVGYDVHWDPERNVIDLMTAAESLPAYTPTDRDTTKTPIRLGERYIFRSQMGGSYATIGVTLTEVLQSSEVASRFPGFFTGAPGGVSKKSLLFAAKIRFEFLEGTGWYKKGLAYHVDSYTFSLKNATDITEMDCMNYNLNYADPLQITLKPGGSSEGYVFFPVGANATGLKVIWRHNRDYTYFDASGS